MRLEKLKLQQRDRPQVFCGDNPLENVFTFKYLGSVLSADGDQLHDIRAKIGIATSRCGKLRHILTDRALPVKLKLRLYEAAVVSVLIYGCETWDINPDACRKLNGANSRMLSWITGKTIPTEARPATTSFNIIKKVRQRRLRWVGHILRQGASFLPYQALKVQAQLGNVGNLLMDTPPNLSLEELTLLAHDRPAWKTRVNAIPSTI